MRDPPNPAGTAVALLCKIASTDGVQLDPALIASDLAMRHQFLQLHDDPIGYYQSHGRSEAIERERIALIEAGAAEWTLEPARWRVEAHDERSDALVVRSAVIVRAFGSDGVAIVLSLEDGEAGPSWRFAGLRRVEDVMDWAATYDAAAATLARPVDATATADDYWGAEEPAPETFDRQAADDDFWAGTEDDAPEDANVDALEQGMLALWRLYGASASSQRANGRRRTFLRIAERVAAT